MHTYDIRPSGSTYQSVVCCAIKSSRIYLKQLKNLASMITLESNDGGYKEQCSASNVFEETVSYFLVHKNSMGLDVLMKPGS